MARRIFAIFVRKMAARILRFSPEKMAGRIFAIFVRTTQSAHTFTTLVRKMAAGPIAAIFVWKAAAPFLPILVRNKWRRVSAQYLNSHGALFLFERTNRSGLFIFGDQAFQASDFLTFLTFLTFRRSFHFRRFGISRLWLSDFSGFSKKVRKSTRVRKCLAEGAFCVLTLLGAFVAPGSHLAA